MQTCSFHGASVCSLPSPRSSSWPASSGFHLVPNLFGHFLPFAPIWRWWSLPRLRALRPLPFLFITSSLPPIDIVLVVDVVVVAVIVVDVATPQAITSASKGPLPQEFLSKRLFSFPPQNGISLKWEVWHKVARKRHKTFCVAFNQKRIENEHSPAFLWRWITTEYRARVTLRHAFWTNQFLRNNMRTPRWLYSLSCSPCSSFPLNFILITRLWFVSPLSQLYPVCSGEDTQCSTLLT